MSFCGKCGSPIPDGSKFCPTCGNSMETQTDTFQFSAADTTSPVNSTPQPEPTPFTYEPYNSSYQTPPNYGYTPNGPDYQPGKKGGNKLLLILILAIVGIAAVIFILIFQTGILGKKSGSSAYEKPVQMLMQSIEDQDAQLIVDILPDEIVDLELEYYEDEQELAEDLASYIFYEFEDYNHIKISYKITDRERLDHEDLDELIDDYSYGFDVDLDITDAYDLDLDVTMQADGEKEFDSLSLTVIKIDGSWYLDLLSL